MNLFDSVKMTKPRSNMFDLSHDVKMSFNMGELVPTMCLDCVPGDKFTIGCESLLRFQALIAPIMHQVYVSMHYFFVPKRLLWQNWENYITNTKVGGSLPVAPYTPAITAAEYTSLCDYLGLPIPHSGNGEVVSILPFVAYQMIYNEYYRDQNLITEINLAISDGNNAAAWPNLKDIRKSAWEHDYFTSALPFAQKGDPVTLPLQFGDVLVRRSREGTIIPTTDLVATANPPGNVTIDNEPSTEFPVTDTLYADTSALQGSTTINDLRRSTRLQEWLEKAARGGSRYIENILAHFGVRSSDRRLDRPEYITGTKSPVMISEVLNTTGTATAPQGQMAGHAISVTAGKYGGYFCEEHGYIMGIMRVLPRTAYFQGVPKHFTKITDPFEHYWPSFANIGEQPILKKEIYAHQGPVVGAETFGYVPRYAEYKYEPSRVAGDMRTTLDHWHMAREFASPPLLNQTFVEADPTNRIFAVIEPVVNKMIAHVFHKVYARRKMPKFGTPTF